MDPLIQALMQRAQAGQQPQPPAMVGGAAPVPAVPPNPPDRVPTQEQRFLNAQRLMQSYRNAWTPNPVLLQASQTK